MSIEDDLKTLAAAHGPKALARAFAQVQGTIKRSRIAARQKWGILAQTFVAAMKIWDGQKADGVSKVQREADLEKTLRAAWPQVRPWKYLCDTCRDVGLEMLNCPGDATCGRGKPHLPHEFGRPCFCRAGARFHEQPRAVPQQLEAKSKPLTRVGR